MRPFRVSGQSCATHLEAAAQAGIQVSRSTVYRWLQRVKAAGEASLTDGRHGHPAKIRGPAHEFLETTCHQVPNGRCLFFTVEDVMRPILDVQKRRVA